MVLPIALPKTFTYRIPEELYGELAFGMRVEVQFGKSKRYAALVVEVGVQPERNIRPKSILSLIDKEPIITEEQLQFWIWMANYYSCSLGEVMNAALPNMLKLNSETILIHNAEFDELQFDLNDKEFMIVEALTIQNELRLEEVRSILNIKTIFPVIQSLIRKNAIFIKEELKHKYKVKQEYFVRFHPVYAGNQPAINEAFDKVQRSEKQTNALLAFLKFGDSLKEHPVKKITKAANVDLTVLKAIAKKGIFILEKKEVSRIAKYEGNIEEQQILSPVQEEAYQQIKKAWKEKNIALLHGVTGSGKTIVYTQLISEAIERGEQVLFLLPEIALTTQLVYRLQKLFGDAIAVYHSKLNNNERVELWNAAKNGKPLIMSARSGLFLPFINLKMIIIDEAHDPSYKQQDPSPRYHGRDAAIYLSTLYNAKVLLGTATPSLESYQNAMEGKYALIEMNERYAGLQMPEMITVNIAEATRKKKMNSHFTSFLIDEIGIALAQKEQVIIFKNRRGYSPTLKCNLCTWHAECIHCDISLTYHRYHNNLQCHYCGYSEALPKSCPNCGNHQLEHKGFGTEKIEDELQIFFPEAVIKRMDYDTTKTRTAQEKIIHDFEDHQIDILVGTQMVTKGLDFEDVGIVGILNADQSMYYPDFRAYERTFQLLIQVSGRAGRKNKRGKVIIQTYNPKHPIIQDVLELNYRRFFQRELSERKEFYYPPYFRMIHINIKHKDPKVLNKAAEEYAELIKGPLGKRVRGPAIPTVPRLRSYYQMEILVKLEKKMQAITAAKQIIMGAKIQLQQMKGFSSVRINVDVDPY